MKLALESQYVPRNDTIHHCHMQQRERVHKIFPEAASSLRKCSIKKCSKRFCKFHRKAPMLESLFNKIAGLKACNFIKNKLQHCGIFKSTCSEEISGMTASVYLKSKLQILQFHKVYKVFSHLFNFAKLQFHQIYICFCVFLAYERFPMYRTPIASIDETV